MKLKKVLEVALVEKEEGQLGSSNWSVGAQDLAKKWDDVSYAQQLKAGGNPGVSAIMKRMEDAFPASYFLKLNNQDVALLKQRINQFVDLMKFRAEKQQQQISQEPETKPGAKIIEPPKRGDTSPLPKMTNLSKSTQNK